MKKLSTSVIFLLFISIAYSQTCKLDSTLIGSQFPVQPLPYDPVASPDGGIRDTACIDKYFEFPFTAVLGESFNFNGVPFPLDSIRIPTVGAVGNLPDGISYSCNPGTCVFVRNTLGCILLSGTVTDPSMIGDHELTISAEVFVNSSPMPFSLTLPLPSVTPGTYTLSVREADFTNCAVVSDFEPLEDLVKVQNVPNPFSDLTTIQINSYVQSEVDFEVVDMTGKRVHSEKVTLREGNNSILFNGSELPEGIYFYNLNNELGAVSGKMILAK